MLLVIFCFGIVVSTTSCEVESADEVAPVVSSDGEIINVAGVYRNSDTNRNNGAFVYPANSGQRVTQINLRQNGNNLEGVINGGRVLRGTIGAARGLSASFSLSGSTSAGNSVTVSGTIEIVDNQRGLMRATWIEPDRYCNVYGTADGPTAVEITPPNNTNNPSIN